MEDQLSMKIPIEFVPIYLLSQTHVHSEKSRKANAVNREFG